MIKKTKKARTPLIQDSFIIYKSFLDEWDFGFYCLYRNERYLLSNP